MRKSVRLGKSECGVIEYSSTFLLVLVLEIRWRFEDEHEEDCRRCGNPALHLLLFLQSTPAQYRRDLLMDELAVLLALSLITAVVILFVKLGDAQARIAELVKRLNALEAKSRVAPQADAPISREASVPLSPPISRPIEPISKPAVSANAEPPPLPVMPAAPARQLDERGAEIPAHPLPNPGHLSPSSRTAASTTREKMEEPVRPVPPLPTPIRTPPISLEAFMGVKLFAWLGGLALFLGVVFFIKYSFDHNLITPVMRVTIGAMVGLGLVAGGWFVPREKYAVTGQTLCATGVVILYGVIFGGHALYGFFGLGLSFALMAVVTAGAFLLAVAMEAQVVAILGLLGGFLTPILLSTGEDRPLALFSYIALLNAGLFAVALRKKWQYLVALAAVATVFMQWGWSFSYFAPHKVFTSGWVFLGFECLFLLPFWLSNREDSGDVWTISASSLMGASALGLCGALLSYPELGQKPWIVLSFALLADAGLVVLPLRRTALHLVPAAGGGIAFLLLACWNEGYLSRPLLPWALGYFVAFAAFHTAVPIFLKRLRPSAESSHWAQIFPALSLVLMLWPAVRIGSSTLLWSAVLLADLAAIALAVYTASILGIVAALMLTLLAAGLWLFQMPVETPDLLGLLTVVSGFAALFCVASAFLQRRFSERAAGALSKDYEREALQFLPSVSAILPFVLLVSVVERLNLANPSPVFGVGLLLIVMLLALAQWSRNEALPLIGLGCGLFLEHAWFFGHSSAATGFALLAWPLVFSAVFFAFPFLFQSRTSPSIMPWASAALAAPLHYGLISDAVSVLWPDFWKSAAGLVPAMLALPLLAAMEYHRRAFPRENPARLPVLAWYGGTALFFITLIFPAQFDREWLTISWALEGAALLWLWNKIPHQGLKITGFGLLCIVFARLALNLEVFGYHERSGTPIFNWYLYTYGIPAATMFIGGRFVTPPRHRIGDFNICATLFTLGTILCFLLLNIEIADFFATGPTLTFDFTGSLARDMTYSIAWSLFALVMLFIGMTRHVSAIRYAGIALLVVTLLKLFLHDLANLDQLYRIGAFIAVAIVLMGASYLYQRFLGAQKKADETPV